MNDKLTMYLHGELADVEHAELEQELKFNKKLQEELGELQQVDVMLRDFFSKEVEDESLGDVRRQRLLLDVRRSNWRIIFNVVSAIAASIVVLFTINWSGNNTEVEVDTMSVKNVESVEVDNSFMPAPMQAAPRMMRFSATSGRMNVRKDFDINLALGSLVFKADQGEQKIGEYSLQLTEKILTVRSKYWQRIYQVKYGEKVTGDFALALAMVLYREGYAIDEVEKILDNSLAESVESFRAIIENSKKFPAKKE